MYINSHGGFMNMGSGYKKPKWGCKYVICPYYDTTTQGNLSLRVSQIYSAIAIISGRDEGKVKLVARGVASFYHPTTSISLALIQFVSSSSVTHFWIQQFFPYCFLLQVIQEGKSSGQLSACLFYHSRQACYQITHVLLYYPICTLVIALHLCRVQKFLEFL